MSDDPIRELLVGLPRKLFWAPPGNAAILEDVVADAGADLGAVGAWVTAQGGHVDFTIPNARRSAYSALPQEPSRRFFVVPETALEPDAG